MKFNEFITLESNYFITNLEKLKIPRK